MNNDDVNDRKQKLNDIIKKITESQLLKMREADGETLNRQDRKFGMNPQKRDNEMNKPMPLKLLSEKERSHFGAAVVTCNPDTAGTSEERTASRSKSASPRVSK